MIGESYRLASIKPGFAVVLDGCTVPFELRERAAWLFGYKCEKAARFIRQSIPWAFASYSGTCQPPERAKISRWYKAVQFDKSRARG